MNIHFYEGPITTMFCKSNVIQDNEIGAIFYSTICLLIAYVNLWNIMN